jgi:hypothetical protein
MSKKDEDNRPFTNRQSWAVFKLYGYDIRESDLTLDEASELIGAARDNFEGWNKDELISVIVEAGGIKKGESYSDKADKFKQIYDKADEAGHKAVEDCKPIPMQVVQRENPLDDSSTIVKAYEPVEGGVCGFAWVNIAPGNHPFCNWLKKNELARKDSYYGGVSIWIHEFEQSMQRKEAYAKAFARVINQEFSDDSKFKQAIGMSRID